MDKSAGDNLKLEFSSGFQKNRVWYFMEVVVLGDNLHEMANPVF